MTTTGVTRRLEALEGCAMRVAAEHEHAGELLMRRVAHLAERISAAGPPARPLEEQSPAERCVRAGLEAAAGYRGDEYRRRFWRALSARLRHYAARGRP
jgi:hypothetical protein